MKRGVFFFYNMSFFCWPDDSMVAHIFHQSWQGLGLMGTMGRAMDVASEILSYGPGSHGLDVRCPASPFLGMKGGR